ncbi:hypothetical protein, partial [[Mycobacterium] vasticus]
TRVGIFDERQWGISVSAVSGIDQVVRCRRTSPSHVLAVVADPSRAMSAAAKQARLAAEQAAGAAPRR